MKEPISNRKENTSYKNPLDNSKIIISIDKINQENMNLLPEKKINFLSNQENFTSKSTFFNTSKLQKANFQKNFCNNSSPKNNTNSKDLFTRIDNSPIKNMDLSPFKNLKYKNNNINNNENPFINGNSANSVKVNLNSRLEDLNNNSNKNNKNLFDSYSNTNNNNLKKISLSPKFFSENDESKQNINLNKNLINEIANSNTNEILLGLNKHKENNESNQKKEINRKIKSNNENDNYNHNNNKGGIFPDIRDGIFLSNISPVNFNNNINTLSRNYMETNYPLDCFPGNQNLGNLFPLNNLNNKNSNNLINSLSNNNNYNIMNNCLINNNNSQLSFSNIINNNIFPSLIGPFDSNTNANLNNLENVNYNIYINNNNNIGFAGNIGFNAPMPTQYNCFYKGIASIYNKDGEIDLKKNPFEREKEKNEISTKHVNPFKRSAAIEELDKYEKSNEVFINNELNYRSNHVTPSISIKPSLNLKESRSRIGIYSKVFFEDFGLYNENKKINLNNNFFSSSINLSNEIINGNGSLGINNNNSNKNSLENRTRNNFDTNAFANLKSKNKKANDNSTNDNNKSCYTEKINEIINQKVENLTNDSNEITNESFNSKDDNIKNKETNEIMNNEKIGNNNTANSKSILDNPEYLKKLMKMQDIDFCYEMIEEFDNEDESKIDESCISLNNTLKKNYLNTSINETTTKIQNTNLINSNDINKKINDNEKENKTCIKNFKCETECFKDNNRAKTENKNLKNLEKNLKEDFENNDTRKRLPENVDLNELIYRHSDLFELCKKSDCDGSILIHYDIDKFKRIVEEEMNLIIPLNKKNDEVFKKKVIAKKILKDKYSENQSARRSDALVIKPIQEILEKGILIIFLYKIINLILKYFKNLMLSLFRLILLLDKEKKIFAFS